MESGTKNEETTKIMGRGDGTERERRDKEEKEKRKGILVFCIVFAHVSTFSL